MEVILWCLGGFFLILIVSFVITILSGESDVDTFLSVVIVLTGILAICITGAVIFTSESDNSAKENNETKNSGEVTYYVPIPYPSPYVSEQP